MGDVEKKSFDFKKLVEITQVVTRNLDRVIDVNYYPVAEAKVSNMRHRPIGIGVQGLADVFMKLRMPFDSKEAQELNKNIFEAIYFGALTASNEIAKKVGTYKTYKGSPLSEGKIQFDLWNEFTMDDKAKSTEKVTLNEELFDWQGLRAKLKEFGVRNSLLTAPMPTASTSQILGNNECFEPYTSNVYIRRTLAGEFVCINQHLLHDLVKLGIWNQCLKGKLITNNGSVQELYEVPHDLKKLYKTVWEIKQRDIINLAADRGQFIDQSQSLNIHFASNSYAKMSSMHFYGWKIGLKTGMYYLRRKAAVDPIKFTVPYSEMQIVDNRKRKTFAKKEEREKIKVFIKMKDCDDEKSDMYEDVVMIANDHHDEKVEENVQIKRRAKPNVCDDYKE